MHNTSSCLLSIMSTISLLFPVIPHIQCAYPHTHHLPLPFTPPASGLKPISLSPSPWLTSSHIVSTAALPVLSNNGGHCWPKPRPIPYEFYFCPLHDLAQWILWLDDALPVANPPPFSTRLGTSYAGVNSLPSSTNILFGFPFDFFHHTGGQKSCPTL